MAKRTQPVYIALAAVWGLVVFWQVLEHSRVRESARGALINRSEDISATLGLVIRSQRRGGGVISQERMENTLNALLKFGELKSVALLNAAGNVVISVGAPLDLAGTGVLQSGERWDRTTATLVNLIDLGAGVGREGETNRPTIILPPRDTNAPAGPPPEMRERERGRMGPPPEFFEGVKSFQDEQFRELVVKALKPVDRTFISIDQDGSVCVSLESLIREAKASGKYDKIIFTKG